VTGWWSALVIADVNSDGRPDIVAGNNGLNSKYRASAAEPTMLFAGDFEGAGRQQIVEAQHEGGRLLPLRGRSKLAYSFPWISRKFPTYRAFASATIEDIFGAERLSRVAQFAATELASGVFTQGADGKFTFAPLPNEAQLAPVNAIVARDFDGDGVLDLFCAGNNFGPEPNTGRFDGSVGLVLKGDGRGGFAAVPPAQAGIVIQGDVRAAMPVALGSAKTTAIAVARCDGPVLLFVENAK
jgi:hypothetical protein